MNTFDRVVRLMYRDLELKNLLNEIDRNSIYDRVNNYFRILEKNKEFHSLIKNKYLEVYHENYNPDEIDNTLDWIENEIKRTGYDNFLGIYFYICNDLFRMINGEIKVKFDKFLEWHGFMNKVDYNIFYAAYLADKGVRTHNHNTYIKHDNETLYHKIHGGIAENHMHLKGSGYTTEMNWYEFISSKWNDLEGLDQIARKNSKLEDKEYKLAIIKIKLIRMYLAFNIYEISSKDEYSKFDSEIMIDILLTKNIEELEIVCNGFGDYSDFPSVIYFIRQEYEKKIEEISKNHTNEKKYIVFERNFLFDMFLKFKRNELTTFQKYIFNIYILGMNKVKFLFTQDNVGMGFEKFKDKEEVKEALLYNKKIGSEIYHSVLDNYYSEGCIKYIEFRIAPKSSVSDYIKFIDQIDLANEMVYRTHKRLNKNVQKIDYGIIVHYIKFKEEFEVRNGLKRKDKLMENLNLRKSVIDSFFELKDSEFLGRMNSCRDSNYILDMKDRYILGIKEEDFFQEVENYSKVFTYEDIIYMEQMNRDSKYYKSKIVGIDTANYELNVRPENFGTIFRSHKNTIIDNHNLNFTYHVGEDFNTIVNGLRAIDEVIEFLGFSRGDRLGHAVALGLDVDKYFSTKRKKMNTTIEDYIDDIIWMYQIIAGSNDNNTGILRYLEDEFSRYKNIYLEGTKFQDIDINEYIDAYNLRGDDPDIYIDIVDENITEKSYDRLIRNFNYENRLNHMNVKHKFSFMNKTARELYFFYQFSKKMKLNSKKELVIDMSDTYKEAAKIAQKILRDKIYNLEIKIETNPSSNKKISSVKWFEHLPLLSFNQYGLGKKTTEYDIPISINTDDSAIFQTNLSSEYSFVAAALIRAGYNREEVYDYIEYISKLSLEHNFCNKC